LGDEYPTGETIRQAREAQGWTMSEAVRTLKQRYGPLLPETDSLVRSWKRWEKGTAPSRFYRPLLSDLLGLNPPDQRQGPASTAHAIAEIPHVFRDQASAAAEIRASAAHASSIDVLAVRGLGLLALNDSLLLPALNDRTMPVRLRVLMLRPGTRVAQQRATEIGESWEAFDSGLRLASARLTEIDRQDTVALEVYEYETLPVWRVIAIDDTLYVSTFAENWEGHESAVYRIVPTAAGPLYRGFRRSFEDLRIHASRII
jgi:hypothetical protein